MKKIDVTEGVNEAEKLYELRRHITTLLFDCLRIELLLDVGMSTSECSTDHPIANKAFKDSLTGSLYLSFSYFLNIQYKMSMAK